MLKPFDGAQYRKRTAVSTTGNECCLCGRETSGLAGTMFVPVNHETSLFVTQAECDADKRDAISLFPIGSECVKKWRKEFDAEAGRLKKPVKADGPN